MGAYNTIVSKGIWAGSGRDRSISRNPEAFRRLRELAEGRTVYELGPGDNGGFLKFLLGVDFRSYIGIEPGVSPEFLNGKFGSENIEFAGSDGLSYLAEVPDERGIVVSSAVFNSQIIKSHQYLEDLAGEIERVTPKGLSTVHFDIGLSGYANPVFAERALRPKLLGGKLDLGGMKAEAYEYIKSA